MSWISVEDRLPEKGKDVLVLLRESFYLLRTDSEVPYIEYKSIGFFCCRNGWVLREQGRQSPIAFDVIYWCGIPEKDDFKEKE